MDTNVTVIVHDVTVSLWCPNMTLDLRVYSLIAVSFSGRLLESGSDDDKPNTCWYIHTHLPRREVSSRQQPPWLSQKWRRFALDTANAWPHPPWQQPAWTHPVCLGWNLASCTHHLKRQLNLNPTLELNCKMVRSREMLCVVTCTAELRLVEGGSARDLGHDTPCTEKRGKDYGFNSVSDVVIRMKGNTGIQTERSLEAYIIHWNKLSYDHHSIHPGTSKACSCATTAASMIVNNANISGFTHMHTQKVSKGDVCQSQSKVSVQKLVLFCLQLGHWVSHSHGDDCSLRRSKENKLRWWWDCWLSHIVFKMLTHWQARRGQVSPHPRRECPTIASRVPRSNRGRKSWD